MNWSAVKRWPLCHLFMGYVFVTSGLLICFLMLCVLPLWIINKYLYRRIICFLTYCHWSRKQNFFYYTRITYSDISNKYFLQKDLHDTHRYIGLPFFMYQIVDYRTCLKNFALNLKFIKGYNELCFNLKICASYKMVFRLQNQFG